MSPTYCPACAETVEPDMDAYMRPHCPNCSIRLVEDVQVIVDGGGERLFDTVLVAEDTRLIREIVKDGLISEGLAQKCFSADDGQQFIALYTDFLYNDRNVDLVILDLQMPILGGAATALALRGIEQGVRARNATIIFFTSHPLTDELRNLMRYCKPAHYLNKGQDASPPRIIKRLREVMRALRM